MTSADAASLNVWPTDAKTHKIDRTILKLFSMAPVEDKLR